MSNSSGWFWNFSSWIFTSIYIRVDELDCKFWDSLNIGSDVEGAATKVCWYCFVHNTVILNESEAGLRQLLRVLRTFSWTWIGNLKCNCERKLCNFPIFSDHLHVPDWQPIGVGSLLFFKWTLERVQNIADLKGTNSVPPYGIFRGGEDTVDNFSFWARATIVTALHYGTDGLWKENYYFGGEIWVLLADFIRADWVHLLMVSHPLLPFGVKSYVNDWSRRDNLLESNNSILTWDRLSIY